MLTTGNNNIYIGNQGGSVESQTIRIGTAQTSTFIAGIGNASVSGATVEVNTVTGQLGVVTNLRDANVKTTVRLLAQTYRVNMVISDDVNGTVTVDFFGTQLRDAFQTIINSAKLSCLVAGDVLRISAAPSKASESAARGPGPDIIDQGEVLVASAGTKVIVWKGQAEMEAGKRKDNARVAFAKWPRTK